MHLQPSLNMCILLIGASAPTSVFKRLEPSRLKGPALAAEVGVETLGAVGGGAV